MVAEWALSPWTGHPSRSFHHISSSIQATHVCHIASLVLLVANRTLLRVLGTVEARME